MRGFRRKRSKPFPACHKHRVKLKKRPNILTRHGRLLSIIGALIVFSTFVVKEAVRERVKDVVDAISGRENASLILNQIGVVRTRIAQLREDLDTNEGPSAEGKANRDLDKKRAFALYPPSITLSQLNEVLRRIDAVTPLTNLFPAKLKETYAKELERDKIILNNDALDLEYFETGVAQASLKDLDQLKDPSDKVYQRQRDIQGYVAEAERVARDFRDEEEKRYVVVTKISYTLYTLGWALALAGRLFGAEDFVAVE